MLSKKMKLALTSTAVGAALAGATTGAYAFDAAYAGAEPAYTQNLVGSAAAQVSNTLGLAINAEVGDLILGRTTGFGVRITLNSGTFAGTALTAAIAPGTAIDDNANLGANTWTTTSVSVGATQANIVFSPAATPVPIIIGDLLTIAASEIDTVGLNTTLGAGSDVTALIEFYDPVTAAILLTDTVTVFQAAEGTTSSFSSQAISADRIDVGDLATAGKTDFSSPGGSINALTGGDALVLTKHLGSATVGLVAGGTSSLDTTFAGWNNAGAFQYNVAVDTVAITLTGDDLAAFTGGSIWVEVDDVANGCAGAKLAQVTASVPTNATFSGTTFTGTVPVTAGTGGTWDICGTVDGTTEIDDQTLTASSAINLDSTNTTAGGLIDPAGAGPATVATLQFNGDVFDVHHVNPTTQVANVSVMRLSNTGATGGKVTLTATDDTGAAGAGSVSFTLDSGESVQLNINDLEVVSGSKTTPNGNAVTGGGFGDGAGKWRVRVTAEFAGLVVTNKNNNVNGGSNNYTTDSSFK